MYSNTKRRMKFFARILLWLLGWKIKDTLPPEIKKCVIIAAPHTSNFDFFIGRLAYWYTGLKISFLIKKESFNFIMGPMLVASGGIPVDRSKNTHLVDRVAEMFNTRDSFYVAITPEGTRQLTPKWRKGFYHIALKANVPIALVYVDYKKKEGGYGPIITPSGDYEKDLKIIQDFYKTITPKYPKKSNLSPITKTSSKTEKSIKELKGQYCCKR